MGFNPASFMKKHRWLGPLLFMAPAAGAGLAGAGLLGAGAASGAAGAGAGAGVGGTVGAETAAELASLYGTDLGAGAAAGGAGAGESALLGEMDLGSSMAFGEYPASSLLDTYGGMSSVADDAYGGMFGSNMPWSGPTAADDSVGNISGNSKSGFKLSAKDALRLASMINNQQQRPMGAPVDSGNPMQRQAMMTQEQITKKWLLENDPTTYARIYGSPQPMGA